MFNIPRHKSQENSYIFGTDTKIQGVPSAHGQGWVDLKFECCNVCPILAGLMGIWQRQHRTWDNVETIELPNQSQNILHLQTNGIHLPAAFWADAALGSGRRRRRADIVPGRRIGGVGVGRDLVVQEGDSIEKTSAWVLAWKPAWAFARDYYTKKKSKNW